MSKYIVERKNVYAGQLIKDLCARYASIDIEGKKMNKESSKSLVSFSGGLVCRGMLFTIKDNVANDLIYTTPTNYEIQPNPFIIKSQFYINECVELDLILKNLGYGEELTQHDLNQIYNQLICSKEWLDKHIELFDHQKSKDEYTCVDESNLPIEIYRKLSNICCYENGKPNKEEPGFTLIKRKYDVR